MGSKADAEARAKGLLSARANPTPETNYCGVAGGKPLWGGRGNNRGCPHPDHPRRCTGTNRSNGRRCKQWALNGTQPPRCVLHGGRQIQKAKAGWHRKDKLPYVYKKYLGPKLTEAVEAATGVDPDEQTALFHELALLRDYAGQYVKLYSAAREAGEMRAINLTGEAMKEALESVAALCEKATKVHDKQRDRFSIHDLKYVVDKIMLIHFAVCGDEYRHIAERFAQAIEKQLTLPSHGANDKGTSLHPDETATAFDATVPYVTEDDEDD